MDDKEMLAEIERLKRENRDLKKETRNYTEKEDFLTSQLLFNRHRDMYCSIPISQMNTVFYSHRTTLEKYGTVTLNYAANASYIENTEKRRYGYFPLLVTDIKQTIEGIVLYMEDPYGEVVSQPLKISMQEGKKIHRHIIIVKALFDEHVVQGHIKVEGYTLTKYGKRSIMDGNISKPITPCEEYGMVSKYSHVKGAYDCMKALDEIQEQAERAKWISNRINKNRLVIYKVNQCICVFVDSDNTLSYIWDKERYVTEKNMEYDLEQEKKMKEMVPGYEVGYSKLDITLGAKRFIPEDIR